jgi:hypothetical protein
VVNREHLYVAGFIAASMADIFISLPFSGTFDVVHWSVFMAFSLVTFYAFERFIGWAVTDSPKIER